MRKDPGQFAFVRELEEHFEMIRDEVLGLPDDVWLPWGAANATRVGVLPLRMVYQPPWIDGDFEGRRALVPKTWQFLAARPKFYGGVLSKLDAGGRILPHADMEEPESVRCHLPLALPSGGTATFRVGEETFAWQEGRCEVFHPCVEHEGWNRGDAPRILFIVDVRPEHH